MGYNNKLPKISSKLIFKRLLLKLNTDNTFMFVLKLYKQMYDCKILYKYILYIYI